MRLRRKSKFPKTIFVNYGDKITYSRVKAFEIVDACFAHLYKLKKPRFLKRGDTELLFAKIEEMCKPYLVKHWGYDIYEKEEYKGFREIAKKSNVLVSYKRGFVNVKKNKGEKTKVKKGS